jgi:hypothetical protein
MAVFARRQFRFTRDVDCDSLMAALADLDATVYRFGRFLPVESLTRLRICGGTWQVGRIRRSQIPRPEASVERDASPPSPADAGAGLARVVADEYSVVRDLGS